jgi:DNA-binding NtrC family response regulator
VIVADTPSVDWAVRFVRAGAYDYVPAPLGQEALSKLLAGVGREATPPPESNFFCEDCPPNVPFVGRSPGVIKSLEMIRLVAQSRCNPILILGATGTGKELAARAVHAWRHGETEAFVAVNCATLTASLMESELFGHVKGAFTGADHDKTGLFELAGAGSLFLDEVSEMPPALQAKLLRVIQEKSFRKVGGTKEIPCRATLIASSNRALLEETERGRFRRDLYYRLAVFPIRIPALHEPSRREDIPLLAEYFLRTCVQQAPDEGDLPVPRESRGLSDEAREALVSHSWPGNVRELRNVIERAAILAPVGVVGIQSLLFDHADPLAAATPAVSNAAKPFSLETAEREFILRAMKETGWQRTRAAMLLGITRATLLSKLKRYNIETPPKNGTPPPPPPGPRDVRKPDAPE